MFVKRNDSLDAPVQKVMKENALRREVVAAVLDAMEVVSEGQLTIQNKEIYNKVLSEVFPLVLAEGFEGNIVEVSKEKLGRYVKRAADNMDVQSYKSGRNTGSPSDKKFDKARQVVRKRKYGIGVATDKLSGQAKVNASEETEINELSKGTLGSYVKKAAKDAVAKGVSSDHYSKEATKETDKDRKRTLYSLADKDALKSDNRVAGIGKAAGKLSGKARIVGTSMEEETAPKGWTAGDLLRRVNAAKNKDSGKRWGAVPRTAGDLLKLKNGERPSSERKSMKEETQINELTKGLIGRYIKAASGNMAGQEAAGNLKKADSRWAGIKQAVDKVTGYPKVKATATTPSRAKAASERIGEENIQELSKEKLQSYVKKASTNLTNNAYNDDDKSAKRIQSRNVAMKKIDSKKKLSEDQLDELSTKKLKGYIMKGYSDVDKKVTDGDHKKANRRMDKMNLASAKVRGTPYARVTAKEETQIDEVSKEKLGAYRNQAMKYIVKNSANSYNPNDKTKQKRLAGKRMADNKLYGDAKVMAKEETQVESCKDGSDTPKKKSILSSLFGKKEKKPLRVGEQIETISELSRDTLSRYINRVPDGSTGEKVSSKRKEGRSLALKKKWGDKKFGLPEPKVKATNESEEIDELSKATLGSYVKKAKSNLAARGEADHGYEYNAALAGQKNSMSKRIKGITTAKSKLDEVSKAKLGKYIDKAEDSARDLQDKSYSSMDAGKGQKLYNKYIQRYDNTNLAKSKVYGYGKAKVKATEETQLDEIQKMTVNRYISKAVDSAHKLGKEGTKKADAKAEKRKRGVACAVNKLHGVDCKVPAGRLSDGF